MRTQPLSVSDDGVYVAVTPALAAVPGLATFLGSPVVRQVPKGAPVRAVLAWGRKASSQRAEAEALRLQCPLLRLEDGFLRSVQPGAEHPPLSLVMDDLGIYYDACSPCRLDRLLEVTPSAARLARAQALIEQWRAARVSKYNHAREDDFRKFAPYVLVVDQTVGDASITCGQADASTFLAMLDAALTRYPDHTVLLKTHPDVVAGRKQGYFSGQVMARAPRVRWIGRDVHVPAMLEHAGAVFCVTSQVGFEALLWGCPVHVFGMPFYAGRGLTHDALPRPAFRRPVSLAALVHAALIDYPRYRHPETGECCDAEAAVEWMGLQRTLREQFPARLYSPRVPRWKRQPLQRFLAGSQVLDERRCLPPAGSTRLVWGMAESVEPVVRVEDGFIRSVGLGADLTWPQSWVFDDVGMYYDARQPSRLEQILQTVEIDEQMRARARSLICKLIGTGVTKYNTGLRDWRRPAPDSRIILVPGQVESDASIRYGSPVVRTNRALLERVRQANPDAWVLYKPHPDVVAGLRHKDNLTEMTRVCDEVVINQDMAYLLTQVDEVHTMTSLAGFEALIRGIPVTCYGQPFYSGWGLTFDCHPCERRTRQRTLEELVAAALILYPRYLSQRTGQFTTVEQVIEEIAQQRAQTPAKLGWHVRISRLLRKAWRF